jgi:hypothetical protein
MVTSDLEVPVSLTNVWVQTQSDGLVRADQIVGIDAHQTPALSGKPARWLLDVALPVSIGSSTREGWSVAMVHRTLVQSSQDPGDAPAALARLLAQLDLVSTAGVITASHGETRGEERTDALTPAAVGDDLVAGSGRVRFRFVPFASPAPGRHTGAEYL